MSCWKRNVVALLFAAGAFLCRGQDYESCTTNFTTLKEALLDPDHNLYALTTVFFPPNVESPLYVTVTYDFGSSSTSTVYMWSKASLYLAIHPRMLQFLSLLFCYVEDKRIVDLKLRLPSACGDLVKHTASDASNFLFVLTERVSVI